MPYFVQTMTGDTAVGVYSSDTRPWIAQDVIAAVNEARYQAARRSMTHRGPVFVIDARSGGIVFKVQTDGAEAWPMADAAKLARAA